MSTEYIFDPPITRNQFEQACAEIGAIPNKHTEGSTDTYYPVEYKGSYVWFNVTDDGVWGTRFGLNVDDVVYDIAKECQVMAWSEHDDEFHKFMEKG